MLGAQRKKISELYSGLQTSEVIICRLLVTHGSCVHNRATLIS